MKRAILNTWFLWFVLAFLVYLLEVFLHGAAFTVGFLPINTAPVTDYATVRKALVNLQCPQAAVSNDGARVFWWRRVPHGCGYSDVRARCLEGFVSRRPYDVRTFSGSGLDDALIEAKVFGERTMSSVLTGSHYYRSMQGMPMIGEMVGAFSWEAQRWSVAAADTSGREEYWRCTQEIPAGPYTCTALAF